MSLSGMSRWQKIGLAAGAVLVLALLGLLIWFLLNNPGVTASLRDILIIVLALETIALGVVLIVLVFQIYKLTKFLYQELMPVVESLQETAGTVRGTATFMSENMVSPAIEVASKAAGMRQSIRVLFGGPGRGRRTQGGNSHDREEG